VTLGRILKKAKKVKKKNPVVSLGYSFVVVWEGVEINGKRLHPNMDEMARSVELAREFSFDYISFKPCLVRLNESQRETLLKNVGKTKEEEIIDQIKVHLQEAKRFAGDQVKILESSNLKAMLNQETAQEMPYAIFQNRGDALRHLSLSGVSRSGRCKNWRTGGLPLRNKIQSKPQKDGQIDRDL
jgi:hypothetical protein